MKTALVSKLTKLTKLALAAVLFGSVITTSYAAGFLTPQQQASERTPIPVPIPGGGDDGSLP